MQTSIPAAFTGPPSRGGETNVWSRSEHVRTMEIVQQLLVHIRQLDCADALRTRYSIHVTFVCQPCRECPAT